MVNRIRPSFPLCWRPATANTHQVASSMNTFASTLAAPAAKSLLFLCASLVTAAGCDWLKSPPKTDPSVQLSERRERSVTDDPAVKGNVPLNGWRVTEGDRPSPPQLPPDEDEVAEFVQTYKDTKAPKILEQELAPGATRTVDLQLEGPSGLAGSAQWFGVAGPLKATIALAGVPLATGTPYPIGTNRGGSYLRARTTGGGHATLSVTNTSGATVRVRLLLVATAL
jgi:hypothetical protein